MLTKNYNGEICLRKNAFSDEERFIKNLLYSSVQIISDEEFKKYGMKNKNIMFFLNYITETLGSVSMLGSRNLGTSILGKIENIINYYDNIIKLFEKKDKNPTIPKNKREYIIRHIKNNIIISDNSKETFLKFIGGQNISDEEFIENLKLIKSSLISDKYFSMVSDKLYDCIVDNKVDEANFDKISILTDEYIALLIDYIGISVFEIKKIIRDAYRNFFDKKDENIFLNMFEKLAEQYNNNNVYMLFIKMDRAFDDKLITALKQSGNDNYIIYSKSGFIKKLKEENINNIKALEQIIEEYDELSKDNNYFLYSMLESKDIWHAIKLFKQNTIQPFIGSMLYSGIKVGTQNNKYIVVECKNDKKYIKDFTYHDDIFKPLSQSRINYSDVFKRYVIENSNNEVNRIIDEAVQLLPYYKNSDSILTKFTNTWFALETLFRNSSDKIKDSLEVYASKLVADRMISGYIYVTVSQIKKTYINFSKLSNNFVENMLLNYEEVMKNNSCNCQYIDWKYKKTLKIVDNYKNVYNSKLLEAIELLDNAYRLRNKQFHGTKDSQLENMSGFLYDIVNDTISFYIDYLDVYKDEDINFSSLFNLIKNIYLIKSSIMESKDNDIEKLAILYDSIRKI